MKYNNLILVLIVSSVPFWLGGCSRSQPDVDGKPKAKDNNAVISPVVPMQRVAVARLTSKESQARPGETESPIDAVWSQDGNRLGVWFSDGSYEVFDTAGNLLDTLHGKETTLPRVGAIPSPPSRQGTYRTSVRGGTVVRTGPNGIPVCNLHDFAAVQYYDLLPGQIPFNERSEPLIGPHAPATLLPDGKTLLVVVSNGKDIHSLVTYDLTERKETRRENLSYTADRTDGVALSADGTKLAWIHSDSVRVFDLKDGKLSAIPIWTFELGKGLILDVQFSPKGRYVAATTKNATIVMNAADGKKYHQIATDRVKYWDVFAFSPDDRFLAVHVPDGKGVRTWRIIDLATKETILETGLRDRLVWHPFQKMFAHLTRTAKSSTIEVYEIRR